MSDGNSDSEVEREVVWLDDSASGRINLPADAVLSIGNVARMFGVSQFTLRYYEMRGLIRRRHSLDGVRVYGWADCERIAFIIKCRKAGVALSDIVMILQATEDDITPLQFRNGQRICAALMDRLGARRRVINQALDELGHLHALLTSRMLGDHKGE